MENKDFKFDKKAAAYDDGFEGRASRRFYKLVLREFDASPGASVLDVGCGTGALLARISDAFTVDAHGIDTEDAMIAVAKAKHPQMDFRVARCEALPFEDQSFDAVIACMAYHHFSDKDGFAREAARVLKPGGVLYIADPRFPLPVRKVLNYALRWLKVVGVFYNAKGIARNFALFGFEECGVAVSAYAQVVKLRLNAKEAG